MRDCIKRSFRQVRAAPEEAYDFAAVSERVRAAEGWAQDGALRQDGAFSPADVKVIITQPCIFH